MPADPCRLGQDTVSASFGPDGRNVGVRLMDFDMTQELERQELVQLVENVLSPKGRGFSSEQINRQLLLFCLHCPDPAAAMDIVLEARRPVTAKQLVDKAMDCPPRAVADVPLSELPLIHPLRHMAREST